MPQRERIRVGLLRDRDRLCAARLRCESRLSCRGTAAGTTLTSVATADARAIRALAIDAAAGYRFRRRDTAIGEAQHTCTSQSCRRQDGWNGKRTHDYLFHGNG